MNKFKLSPFINLLKATRVKRILMVLMVILIPAAYSNNLPSSLLPLSLVAILIYSAASIHNAYKDNDYQLPEYFQKIVFVLLGIALIISIFNKIIFIAAILWMTFGFIYNTFARRIRAGDTLIAGLTHFVIPVVSSSILVGLSIRIIVPLATLLYLLALCIGPVTNLKDIEEDKKRGYRTLVNTVKNPKRISAILLNFSLVILFSLYAFFGIRKLLFLFIVPFILERITLKQIYRNNMKKALNQMRLYLIVSFAILIFILATNYLIITVSLLISLVYLFTIYT